MPKLHSLRTCIRLNSSRDLEGVEEKSPEPLPDDTLWHRVLACRIEAEHIVKILVDGMFRQLIHVVQLILFKKLRLYRFAPIIGGADPPDCALEERIRFGGL
jgi:hypothetical protein